PHYAQSAPTRGQPTKPNSPVRHKTTTSTRSSPPPGTSPHQPRPHASATNPAPNSSSTTPPSPATSTKTATSQNSSAPTARSRAATPTTKPSTQPGSSTVNRCGPQQTPGACNTCCCKDLAVLALRLL